MNMQLPSNRLRARVLTGVADSNKNLTINDIMNLGLDSSIILDIQECLTSSDTSVLSTGFLFFNALLNKHEVKEFGVNFISFLISRIPLLFKHPNAYVRQQALSYYIWLRNNFSNYREVMLKLLHSEDLGFRRAALNSYETYSIDGEISPLLHFKLDTYASEESMGGPWRYELRDLALEKIESICGKKFRKNELSEPYNGVTVAWFDWGDFLNWWNAN